MELRYSLPVQAAESCRAQNEHCELRASAAGGFGPSDSASRNYNGPFAAPTIRVRRTAEEIPHLSLHSVKFAASGECNELRRVAALRLPGRRTAQLCESQEPGQQHSPIHYPNLSLMLGPARRENRGRFSRPKNSTAQSKAQFSASCPPHCGSAFAPPRFAVARWDFISILLSQNEQNPSLGGRVTAFSHTVEFFRAPFFVRAPGKSCQNVPAHFDDFPFKATARGRALTRLKLASGRPGPTSRGREMLTHFNWQPLPQQLTTASAHPHGPSKQKPN